jgi:hypothetical protein
MPVPDNRRVLAVAQFALLLLPILAASCVERDGVTSYTVKNVAPDRARPAAAASSPGQAWFFKLLGNQPAVQAETEPFAKLMASVRFAESGLPTWETPTGWTERKESGMRFATLLRDGSDPPLEIAVSALPSDDPGGDAYLKSNIDRWRGQVGLEPYSGADWKTRATEAGEIREADAAGGRFVLVQLTGKNPAGEALTMLAAIVPRPAAAPLASAAAEPVAAADDAAPTYTAPAEWSSQPPRQFQSALWSVSQGEQKVEISVSQSGGSLEANLGRWRGQVGPGADGATEPALESLTIGNVPATRVELQGAEQVIVGVIVPRGATSWFFKMMGPATLVDQERERFRAFVESIQFP